MGKRLLLDCTMHAMSRSVQLILFGWPCVHCWDCSNAYSRNLDISYRPNHSNGNNDWLCHQLPAVRWAVWLEGVSSTVLCLWLCLHCRHDLNAQDPKVTVSLRNPCIYTLNCRWLMVQGRESEAREVLRKTVSKLGQEGIEAELEDIRQSLNSGPKINILQELKLILKWRNLKRYTAGHRTWIVWYHTWLCYRVAWLRGSAQRG